METQSLVTNSSLENKQLSQLNTDEIARFEVILSGANLIRASRDGFMSDAEFATVAKWIFNDYSWITVVEVAEVIELGCKGKFRGDKFEPLNAPTIYYWFQKAMSLGVICKPTDNKYLNGAIYFSPEAIMENAAFSGVDVETYLWQVFKCTVAEYEAAVGKSLTNHLI